MQSKCSNPFVHERRRLPDWDRERERENRIEWEHGMEIRLRHSRPIYHPPRVFRARKICATKNIEYNMQKTYVHRRRQILSIKNGFAMKSTLLPPSLPPSISLSQPVRVSVALLIYFNSPQRSSAPGGWLARKSHYNEMPFASYLSLKWWRC